MLLLLPPTLCSPGCGAHLQCVHAPCRHTQRPQLAAAHRWAWGTSGGDRRQAPCLQLPSTRPCGASVSMKPTCHAPLLPCSLAHEGRRGLELPGQHADHAHHAAGWVSLGWRFAGMAENRLKCHTGGCRLLKLVARSDSTSLFLPLQRQPSRPLGGRPGHGGGSWARGSSSCSGSRRGAAAAPACCGDTPAVWHRAAAAGAGAPIPPRHHAGGGICSSLSQQRAITWRRRAEPYTQRPHLLCHGGRRLCELAARRQQVQRAGSSGGGSLWRAAPVGWGA